MKGKVIQGGGGEEEGSVLAQRKNGRFGGGGQGDLEREKKSEGKAEKDLEMRGETPDSKWVDDSTKETQNNWGFNYGEGRGSEKR